MVRALRPLVVLAVVAFTGCKPEFDDRTSLIDGPRILGVRSTPAEAPPGAHVVLDALYVDHEGSRPDAPIDWALCRERKPLTELGPVSPACFVASSSGLVPLGNGPRVNATIFADACRLFGPNAPEAKKGEPAGRPVDPDPTGGFYVPSRLWLLETGSEGYATGQTRLACEPGRVSPDQARDFRRLYRANENPVVGELVVAVGAREEVVPPSDVQSPPHLNRGEVATLRVAWPSCPVAASCGDGICGAEEDAASCADDCREPHGCGGAEPYVAFDPLTLELGERRETIRASWFATAGQFDFAATGTAGDGDQLASTTNTWRAPDVAGVVHLWVVLRDDRRGIGWQAYDVTVD